MCPKCGIDAKWSRTYVPPNRAAGVHGVIFMGECIILQCGECGYPCRLECYDAVVKG